MNKKSKKLSMKEIYNKCNHDKYTQITEIKGRSEVKSNYKNFIINYKIPMLIIFLILLALFIYIFRNNPILILYCFGIILLFFIFAIYNCTYKLRLNEKTLDLQINFQRTQIKTDDLVTIYLSSEKTRFLGIPMYSYSLNIIYAYNEKPMLITIPTVMSNKKQIVKLFANIETEKIKTEEEK